MGAAKETLELEIKILISEARKNVQDMQGEIKRLAQEAQKAAPETKALASAMKTINGDEMKRAAAEAKLFGDSLGTLKKQQSIVRAAMIDMVKDGLDPQSAEIQKLVSQYKALESQSDKLEKQSAVTAGSLGDMTATIGQLATVKALTTVVGHVIAIGDAALETAKQFQKTEQTFGVLLGDMAAGRALAKEIQAFNVWTPFDLANIETATKGLLGVKVPVDQLTKKMTMFGDLSLGNAEKFNSFTNEFVKASAKGKVSLENLNVYLEQGVPVLDTLADQFNTTSDSVTDMVSKGQISVADFEKALVTLSSKGGQYYKGMVTGSQSLEAVQIGLKEAQGQLTASFLTGFIPALTTVTQWMTDLTNAVNESPLLKGLLAGAVVAVTAYLAAMAIQQTIAIAKTWLQYAAQMAFNSSLAVTNPLIIAGIVAVGVATAAAIAYAASQMKAADATDKAALATVTTVQNQKLLEEQAKKTTTAVGEQIESLYDWKKSLADFSAPMKSIEELETKIAYLKTLNTQTITVQVPVTDDDVKKGRAKPGTTKTGEKLVSDLINDLNTAFSAYQTDYFGGAYDDFKSNLEKAKAALADFAKESIPKQSKVQIIDTEKEKYNAAAVVAFTGTDLQEKLTEINDWYLKSRLEIEAEVAAQDRENVLKDHDLRMAKAKEEWEYKQELARLNIESGKGTSSDYANYAAGSAMTQISDTDAGQAAMGTDVLTMFIDAIIEAVIELENVNKLLNFVGTIVDAAFDIFGPILDSGAGEFVDILVEVGTIIGQVIAPFMGTLVLGLKLFAAALKIILAPIQAIGNAFEWLYNNIIVPVANKFIDIINGVIDALNHIPFVNISKLDKLKVIGDESEALADAISAATDKINDAYDDKIDAINNLLDAQIDSLKKQYELGLISGTSYDSQAAAYQTTADTQIDALETERNKLLAAIEAQTDVAGVESLLQDILDNVKGTQTLTLTTINGETASSGSTTTTTDNIGSALAGAIATTEQTFVSEVLDFLDSLWPFADGSSNILSEMPSIVHPGEIIVPKTFADGVRSGELSISGTDPEETASSSKYSITNVTVELTVEGSVTTEKDLVSAVHEGISKGIISGELDKIPA